MNQICKNYLDLDKEVYFECLNDPLTETEVMNTFNEGINAHVKGTPTFFVEGEMISGSKSEDLKQLERMIQNVQVKS